MFPKLSRRQVLKSASAGFGYVALAGLLGQQAKASAPGPLLPREPHFPTRAKRIIFVFMEGAMSQLDTFDLKPDTADGIRGDFKPIATNTTGIQICEHLPLLAQRSHMWSLVRSLTHPSNGHSEGHLFMLTGRSQIPPGFSPSGKLGGSLS